MTTAKTLYLITCAAPPARSVAAGIRSARAAGWDVCLVPTPSAHRWLEPELPALRELTGHPVRHQYKARNPETTARGKVGPRAPRLCADPSFKKPSFLEDRRFRRDRALEAFKNSFNNQGGSTTPERRFLR
jgi:hypothetical protein